MRLLIVLVFLLTGCAPSYQYSAKSEADPTIIHGDSPLFSVPTLFLSTHVKGETPKCKDHLRVEFGASSIKVPAGKAVNVSALGTYIDGLATYACSPKGRVFYPGPYEIYAIDVVADRAQKGCILNIRRTKDNVILNLAEAPFMSCSP